MPHAWEEGTWAALLVFCCSSAGGVCVLTATCAVGNVDVWRQGRYLLVKSHVSLGLAALSIWRLNLLSSLPEDFSSCQRSFWMKKLGAGIT